MPEQIRLDLNVRLTLGVTESEWEAMTEEERDDLVKEFLGDIFECWVKPAND